MKYFELYELVDRATYEQWGENAWGLFSPDILHSIDGVRDFLGVPVIVNNWYGGGPYQYRGYRGPNCPIGAEYSYHKKGMAIDFDTKEYSAETIRKMIIENQDDERLKRIMRMEKDVSWVHIDLGKLPVGKRRIYLFKG